MIWVLYVALCGLILWWGISFGAERERQARGLLAYFKGEIRGTIPFQKARMATVITTERVLPVTSYHYKPARHSCYVCRKPMTIVHTSYLAPDDPWDLYICRTCHPDVDVR